MNEGNCPMCPNHCQKNNLRCKRGREYFNDAEHDFKSQTLGEKVVMDLRKCGHLLHHNKELNTNELLSDFSEKELNTLHELLSKINKDK